jgi:hypothetical protein
LYTKHTQLKALRTGCGTTVALLKQAEAKARFSPVGPNLLRCNMTTLRQSAAAIAIGFLAMLSGCADRPMPVPSTATLMSEGNGDRIAFMSTHFGRVYVSDQTDDKILYQGEVQRGDTVEVRPKEDRIMIGGRITSDRPLDDGHQYRIFFEPLTPERTAGYHIDVTPQY